MQIIMIICLTVAAVLLLINIIITIRGQKASVRAREAQDEQLERSLFFNREELNHSLDRTTDSLLKRINETSLLQNQQANTSFEQLFNSLDALTRSNEDRLEKMRDTVERQISNLQAENMRKLEQMRLTVDEQLNTTLEKRLGDSFQQVSERLEQVHKGLGEMQVLAVNVGDLKKVLSNVKTRGILGEMQLSALLEQILTADQYAENVATKAGSNARVEFAVKMPGRDDQEVWLPIDAKFPLDSYNKMLDAYETGNNALLNEAGNELERRIKSFAKDIHDKYLDPPQTTDFGLMFLPVEGLYAEVLRRNLFELIQREYNVIITGPTTIAALLNSLQMGFRTLALEKRSSEVWVLLESVKTEFSRFGELLSKTQKKLQEASTSIEAAERKSRTIQRRLRNVQDSTSAAENYESKEDSEEEFI